MKAYVRSTKGSPGALAKRVTKTPHTPPTTSRPPPKRPRRELLVNAKCVLVAHRGGARYLCFDEAHRHLHVTKNLVFPKGKLRSRDLDSDRAGRSAKSTRHGSVALDRETNSVAHEELLSAKKIVAFALKQLGQLPGAKLVVAAGPHLLGLLRKVLRSEFRKNEITFFAKDLAKVPDSEILEYVQRSRLTVIPDRSMKTSQKSSRSSKPAASPGGVPTAQPAFAVTLVNGLPFHQEAIQVAENEGMRTLVPKGRRAKSAR